MQLLASNNAVSALALGIGPSDTTCNLQGGTGALFANPSTGQYFPATIISAATGLVREIVYVLARSGDTVTTMLRGQEGTTPTAFLAGDFFWNQVTAGTGLAFAQLPAFAGTNPNGLVPGVAASAYGAASLVVSNTNSVWICVTSGTAASAVWVLVSGSERLRPTTSVLNVYIAPPPLGNDSNSGLSPSSPFATLQRAWVFMLSSVDLNYGQSCFCSVADGTYSATPVLEATGTMLGQTDASTVVFQGNVANPQNVLLVNPAGGPVIQGYYSQFSLGGFTIGNPGGALQPVNSTVVANIGCTIYFNDIAWGGSSYSHTYATNGGQIFAAVGDTGVPAQTTIQGSAYSHMYAAFGGTIIYQNTTVTLNGALNFTGAFAYAVINGNISALANTYNGAATGQRYQASLNGVIDTGSGRPDYFPGTAAGQITSGGQYT